MRGAVSPGGVLPPQRQLPAGREAAQTGTACRQVAESRIRDWLIGDWLIGVQSPPAMYARHMVDGRSHTVKGDGSEKESQVRHLGTEAPPWFRAGPPVPPRNETTAVAMGLAWSLRTL